MPEELAAVCEACGKEFTYDDIFEWGFDFAYCPKCHEDALIIIRDQEDEEEDG